ncbi:unnamed protein product [Rotaria sordida]|nr:unnamed protein product [Rotaria sordida]
MAEISEDWIKGSSTSSNNIIEYVPIEKYWYKVMPTVTTTSAPQHVVLTKLAKYLLSLSHGNSDIKRGFSQNNYLVQTTSVLLSNVQDAHSRYVKDNEEQQKLMKNIDIINGK